MNKKELLMFSCQACINAYKGVYGQVIPIFAKEEEFRVSYVEGVFGHTKDALFIIFPGSIELKDWIDDFRFSKQLKVHKGFLKQYEMIKDVVFEKVNKKEFSKIYVVGYSMGAATATLCAADLHKNAFDVELITFGSPRVGDAAFVSSYPVTSYRVVNACDIVTRLPMLVLGYQHIGEAIEVGKKKWYKYFGSFLDHWPQRYLEGIGEINEQ